MIKKFRFLGLAIGMIALFCNFSFGQVVPADNNMKALILVGKDDDAPLRYNNDAKFVYLTLTEQYGFTAANITVLYTNGANKDLDNDPNTINVDGAATKVAVQECFSTVYNQYSTPTNLFVFITGMGGNGYVTMNGDVNMTSTELAGYLIENDARNMVFLFGTPSASDFKTQLLNTNHTVCKNRTIQIASTTGSPKREMWIIPTNYEVSEYMFYWAASARGFYPSTTTPAFSTTPVGQFNFTPYFGAGVHPLDYSPDTNGDGFKQLSEAFNYSNNFNTWTSDANGFYYPKISGQSETTIFERKTACVEDIMCLNGMAGNITNSQTISRILFISGNVAVAPNVVLTPLSGTGIYLNNSAQMTFGQSAGFDGQIGIEAENFTTLSCHFFSTNFLLKLTNINLLPTFESNLSALTLEMSASTATINNINNINWLWLKLSNSIATIGCQSATHAMIDAASSTANLTCQSISLLEIGGGDIPRQSTVNIQSNTCTFQYIVEYCNLNFNCRTITGFGSGYRSNISFNANSLPTGSSATLSLYGQSRVSVNGYSNYRIYNSTIEHTVNETSPAALSMVNCGSGTLHTIENCNLSSLYGTALRLYNTTADITNCKFKNSVIGIESLNNSRVSIAGQDALYEVDAQQITGNSVYQLYSSSRSSFPVRFTQNAIHGNNVPYIYCANALNAVFDVENNYWGTTFNEKTAFYPANRYTFDPMWYLIPEGKESAIEETLYLSANTALVNQDYQTAETTYKNVISNYPQSKYAMASLKALISVEANRNGDFTQLQNYYNSLTSSDAEFTKLAHWLANHCNVKKGDYQSALDWYSAVLANPETLEDSVFAAIDIADIYQEMQQGNSNGRIAFAPEYPELVFDTENERTTNRNNLIDLLYKNKVTNVQNANPMLSTNVAEIKSIYPNPASTTANVTFNLSQASRVSIVLYNLLGTEVYRSDLGEIEKGTWNSKIDTHNLTSGIYLCALFVNNQKVQSVKIIVE